MTEQQLPEGWQMVKFGDIAKHISKRVEPSETDLKTYVGLEHLDPDSLKIKRHGVPADVEGQKLLVKKGQIIFGKRRAYQRKVAVVDWDCICSAHAMVLEANPKTVISEFLPFFMQSDVFMNRAVAISEGSLSPTIKWKSLSSQHFFIPNLERQAEICRILKKVDETFECVEELESSLIILRDEIVRNLLNPNSKNTEIWHQTKLSQLCDVITKGTTPSTYGFKFQDEGISFIKAESISNCGEFLSEKITYISEECDKSFKRSQLSENDILFSIAGVIGRTAIVNKSILPANTNQAIAIIRLKNKNVLPKFIDIQLNSQAVRNEIKLKTSQAAQPNLNLKSVGSLTMTVIPLDRQQKIVSEYRLYDDMLNTIKRKKEQLSIFKKSIFVMQGN